LKYILKELLDVQILQELLFSLNEISKVPCAIVDLDGNILTSTTQQNICTEFHCMSPSTVKKCIENGTCINAKTGENGTHFVYRCPMGIMDCATSIAIDGEHLGNVFIGQFFMEQPDESYFMMQARQCQYDESKYLEAIRKVPIFSEEQLHKNLTFIENLVRMLADQGLQRKRQLEYQEELNESGKKLKIVFDNVEAGIIVVSRSGTITFANRQMAEMFGMSLTELIGTHYVDHLYESEKHAGIKSMGQIVDGNVKSVELDRRYVRKDGSDFWGHLTGTRFDNTDGSMRDQIIVISDITERKQAEEVKKILEQQLQQAQKMESLGVLAGGIAHDFNNILSIIIGNSYLAKLNLEAAEGYISTIEQAAERAAGLCRQMLSYAGKATCDIADVDIRALLDDLINMLKSTVTQNVAITYTNSTQIPFVKGDVNQLGQIVINLIINASEAIGSKQGEIHVELSNKDIRKGSQDTDHLGKVISAGQYVCLEVRDNGCGMEDETKQRIFEPFYTTKPTGRGLGMSAVLGIISAHNGALQLTSHLSQGTTFNIYLPAHVNSCGVDQSKQQVFSSSAWQGSGTILLAEDMQEIRTMVKSMLCTLGFEVIEAANGKEALELYEKRAADIKMVLTDIGMPIMDGYELFRELKIINPKLPIMVSSGYGDAAVTSKIERSEIAGLVNKPYRIEQLQDVLRTVVECY